jgi:hypothetical protein
MKITPIKVLSSGYCYARAVGYHHLFAQWPRYQHSPTIEDVSHNGVPKETVLTFLQCFKDPL